MSAVILIVMRPVFTTHYLSQSPFVLFHAVASMKAAATAGTPAAAAELSTTTTTEKSWRGAKINALDLVFHNSIVVRNRHNVNICRDGAGNLRKGNTSWWGRGWGPWLFSCSIRQSQAKMNEWKTNAESKHKPTVVEKSLVYILLSLRAAHNRPVFRPYTIRIHHTAQHTNMRYFRRCIRNTMTKHSLRNIRSHSANGQSRGMPFVFVCLPPSKFQLRVCVFVAL